MSRDPHRWWGAAPGPLVALWERANRPLPGVRAGLGLLWAGLTTAIVYSVLARNAFSVFLAVAFVSPFVFYAVTALLGSRTVIRPATAAWCFAALPALVGLALAVSSFWAGSWMLAAVTADALVVYGGIAGSRGLARWRAGPSTQCLWCGYSFGGLASQGCCPECGRQYKRKTENNPPVA